LVANRKWKCPAAPIDAAQSSKKLPAGRAAVKENLVTDAIGQQARKATAEADSTAPTVQAFQQAQQ
jgi:hypothetical protein